MLTRLAELMFIEVLRRYLEDLPPGQTGWLAGLRDELVGRVLAAACAAGPSVGLDDLAGERQPLLAIGTEAGYESEAAFTRAFKKATGSSPDASRRATRA